MLAKNGSLCDTFLLLARYLFHNIHDETVVSKFRSIQRLIKNFETSTPCQDELVILKKLISAASESDDIQLQLVDKELLLIELSNLVADVNLIDELREPLSEVEIASAQRTLQNIDTFVKLNQLVLQSIKALGTLADKIESQTNINKDTVRELFYEFSKVLNKLHQQKVKLFTSEKQKEEAKHNSVILDLHSVRVISDRLQDLMQSPIPHLPTFPEFDRWLFGGIYPQTATLFVAPVNHGKTSIMLNMIARFLYLAKHYPFDTTLAILKHRIYNIQGTIPDSFKEALRKIEAIESPELRLKHLLNIGQRVFKGKKPAAVYIGFESNIDLLMLKFFSILLGKKVADPAKWLKNMDIAQFTQSITDYFKKLDEKCLYLVPIFKRAPKHGYTVDDIWYYLDLLRQEGYEPMVVFIDYLAYLKPIKDNKNSSAFERETQIVNELYSLTEEVPIVSAVQTKKAFLNPTYADINSITLDSVKGFGRALEIFDTIFAAIRIPNDHSVVFKVLKARDTHITFNEIFMMRYNPDNYKLFSNINLLELGVNPYSSEYKLWLEQHYNEYVQTPDLKAGRGKSVARASQFDITIDPTVDSTNLLLEDLLNEENSIQSKKQNNKPSTSTNKSEFDILDEALGGGNDNISSSADEDELDLL